MIKLAELPVERRGKIQVKDQEGEPFQVRERGNDKPSPLRSLNRGLVELLTREWEANTMC
jgi:hypothetical protein